MEINGFGQSQPTDRKKAVEQAAQRRDQARAAGQAPDATVSLDLDPAAMASFVQQLKEMEPGDVHRVEELRAQIENGSYTAEVDELVDPLLGFLGEDPSGV